MCPARSDLLDHVVKATRAYAQLANLLSEKVGVLSRDAYEEMSAGVEFSRKIAEIAREALVAHEREHGCGRGQTSG